MKKEKLEIISKVRKTAYLETLQNFDGMEKMNAGFGISDPKLIKFD